MSGEFEITFERMVDMDRKGRLKHFLETGEEYTTEELARLCRMRNKLMCQKLKHLESRGQVEIVRFVDHDTFFGNRKMAVWRIKQR